MSDQVSSIARRLSAMFTEDGDSRDSGYSDTTSSDGRTIPSSATMFSSLDDDNRDMDEVFMPEDDSNDSCRSAISMIREELVRVKTVDNNNQENITVSRITTEETTFVGVPRLHRSSTVKLPRKRAIHSCEDVDVIDVKRARVSVLTVIQNDTPPSRKFLKKQNTLTRINSTSILEVKAHEDETGEHIPEIVQTIYSLPIIDVKDCSMAYRRIEPETLGNLMKTLSPEDFHARYILIDCRYPFEFSGGHIRNAVNLYEQDDCHPYFFCEEFDSLRIPIFYCEYSQKRGPSMASVLRRCDRIKNMNCYPNIKFSEIYVLDQGYKGFFEWARINEMDSFCTPNAYVRMDDRRYKAELKAFPFHKKCSRGPLIKLDDEKKRRSPIRSRRLLFKAKTVALTPSSPIREDQDLSPCRLNFSISSPESSFL